SDILPADDDPADVERQRAAGEDDAEDNEDGDRFTAPAGSHTIKLTRLRFTSAMQAPSPKREARRRGLRHRFVLGDLAEARDFDVPDEADRAQHAQQLPGGVELVP